MYLSLNQANLEHLDEIYFIKKLFCLNLNVNYFTQRKSSQVIKYYMTYFGQNSRYLKFYNSFTLTNLQLFYMKLSFNIEYFFPTTINILFFINNPNISLTLHSFQYLLNLATQFIILLIILTFYHLCKILHLRKSSSLFLL